MNILRKITTQYNKTFNSPKKRTKRTNIKSTLKNKQLHTLKCSPLSSNNSNNSNNTKLNTCYSNQMIDELVSKWNNKHKNNTINTKLNMNTKYTQLSRNLLDKCDNERCWAKTLMKKDVDKYLEVFAPFSPTSWIKNPTEWLSNIEILDALKQYEKYDKKFKFLGTTPIDFDTTINNVCVTPILCNFQLSTYIKSGKDKLAIIFNTDKHTETGSHWISLYIHISQGVIFFFDSAGNKCPQLVLNLVNISSMV